MIKEVTEIVCLFCVLCSVRVSPCAHGDVRLVGGTRIDEGNVQICNEGIWGYVCDHEWEDAEARVVCTQLGYSADYKFNSYKDAIYQAFSFYGYGNGTVWLDYVACHGNEKKLIDCPSAKGFGKADCGYDEIAGVFCQHAENYEDNCTDGDIRLGYSIFGFGRSEGIVGVCYNDSWGTVCDDSWNSEDASVACKQLGYVGYIDFFDSSKYGIGNGPILLSGLNCTGSENSLFTCSAEPIGKADDCSHYNDAGLRCYSINTSPCVNGEVMLWSAYNSSVDSEGIPLVCLSGTWYPVHKHTEEQCRALDVLCTTAGYAAGIEYADHSGGKYYGYYYYPHLTFACNDWDKDIADCFVMANLTADVSWDGSLRMKCKLQSSVVIMDKCTPGDVQLVGGQIANEGRIEYCYNGEWVPMCSLSDYTASMICRYLGYTKYAIVISDEEYGRSKEKSIFQYLACSSGSHLSLSECGVVRSCATDTSSYSCRTQYGVMCYAYNSENCTNGDVRLADGNIEQEGRLEVCVDGVWGSVCVGQSRWTASEGHVACMSLGYHSITSPEVYSNSEFGMGLGPIVWSSVQCSLSDENIHDCRKIEYPWSEDACDSSELAGVRCPEGCSNGEVRIIGYGNNNTTEGIVEVCFNELWGLISDDGWSDKDAVVVCKQLGYTDGAVSSVLQDKPKKAIHLTNVDCFNESKIINCTFVRLSLEKGKQLLQNTTIAGVNCWNSEPNISSTISATLPATPALMSPSPSFSLMPPPSPSPSPSPIPPKCPVDYRETLNTCSSKGSVRLMNNSIVSSSEGRVEYCNGQYWTPLCAVDNKAAAVICKEQGHTNYQWATIKYLKMQDGISLVDTPICNGNENSLAECTMNTFDDDACLECSNGIVSLRCHDQDVIDPLPQCTEGRVRLENSSAVYEGRVEVCVNGVWGSICDKGWDEADGVVVCHQLGYDRQVPFVYYNSHYGDGDYPIVYSNVHCKGSEENINDCEKDGYLNYTCPQGHVAGLKCITSSAPGTNLYLILGGALAAAVLFMAVIIMCLTIILMQKYCCSKKAKHDIGLHRTGSNRSRLSYRFELAESRLYDEIPANTDNTTNEHEKYDEQGGRIKTNPLSGSTAYDFVY